MEYIPQSLLYLLLDYFSLPAWLVYLSLTLGLEGKKALFYKGLLAEGSKPLSRLSSAKVQYTMVFHS